MISLTAKKMASDISNAVNTFCFDYAHFCSAMEQQHSVAQTNFTSLCISWFKRVASDEYHYDARNERAHLACKNILSVMEAVGAGDIPPMTFLDAEPLAANMSPDSPEELAAEIGTLIVRKDFDLKMFLLSMEWQHRTLQQSFTRLCIFWIRWVARKYHDSLTAENTYNFCKKVINAVDAAKVETSLPLI